MTIEEDDQRVAVEKLSQITTEIGDKLLELLTAEVEREVVSGHIQPEDELYTSVLACLQAIGVVLGGSYDDAMREGVLAFLKDDGLDVILGTMQEAETVIREGLDE